MIKANIHDAKTHLSEYLSRLDTEGEILLCKRNIPVARIVPVESDPGSSSVERELGGAQLGVNLEAGFWDQLDEETLAAFSGE